MIPFSDYVPASINYLNLYQVLVPLCLLPSPRGSALAPPGSPRAIHFSWHLLMPVSSRRTNVPTRAGVSTRDGGGGQQTSLAPTLTPPSYGGQSPHGPQVRMLLGNHVWASLCRTCSKRGKHKVKADDQVLESCPSRPENRENWSIVWGQEAAGLGVELSSLRLS